MSALPSNKKRFRLDGTRTTEQLRMIEKNEHTNTVVRLGDELTKLIQMCAFAREAIENELFSGLGYKKMAITDKDLAKVEKLARMLNSATDAKIRFDKAQKAMVDEMSPEEEKQSVMDYLYSLPMPELSSVRDNINAYQARRGLIPTRNVAQVKNP